MSGDEVADFAKRPFVEDAVQLRRYEDGDGKRSQIQVPDLSQFKWLLQSLQINADRS